MRGFKTEGAPIDVMNPDERFVHPDKITNGTFDIQNNPEKHVEYIGLDRHHRQYAGDCQQAGE